MAICRKRQYQLLTKNCVGTERNYKMVDELPLKEENEENMMWFMNNHPFKLESIDEFVPDELKSETTSLGYLQLLPGVHGTDGFFMAKFRRK